MTREYAVAAAKLEAEAFGATVAVYRFPRWRDGVYGVRVVDKLPAEAQRFEVFAGSKPPEFKYPDFVEPAAPAGQGSLF